MHGSSIPEPSLTLYTCTRHLHLLHSAISPLPSQTNRRLLQYIRRLEPKTLDGEESGFRRIITTKSIVRATDAAAHREHHFRALNADQGFDLELINGDFN